jgi:hypothetical protein
MIFNWSQLEHQRYLSPQEETKISPDLWKFHGTGLRERKERFSGIFE